MLLRDKNPTNADLSKIYATTVKDFIRTGDTHLLYRALFYEIITSSFPEKWKHIQTHYIIEQILQSDVSITGVEIFRQQPRHRHQHHSNFRR